MRRMPLHVRILTGAAIGIVAGLVANWLWGDATESDAYKRLAWVIKYVTGPIGAIFLRLLMMLVAPLLFAALVMGVSELGDLRRLGRIGVKTLLYTIAVS